MAKKKKYRGHYCKICGEIKANEKLVVKNLETYIYKSVQSYLLKREMNW